MLKYLSRNRKITKIDIERFNILDGDYLITPTPDAGDNSSKIATTHYTDRAIANLVDSAPTTLDTLNEIANALNNDDDAFNTLLSINSDIQAELDRTQIGSGLTNDDIPNPAYDPVTNPDVPQFAPLSGDYQTNEDSNYLKSQDFADATLSANLFNRDDLVTWLFADAITNSVNLIHPDTKSKSLTGYVNLFQELVCVFISLSLTSDDMNCKLMYLPLAPVTKAVLPA